MLFRTWEYVDRTSHDHSATLVSGAPYASGLLFRRRVASSCPGDVLPAYREPWGRTCKASDLPLTLPRWYCSVTQSCLTLCNPMDCRTPGFWVLHYLSEFVQTHVHWVGDAIQPSHPLSSPSPPALSLSQHQGLFLMLGVSWPRVSCLLLSKDWSFSFSISPSSEYSGLISFRMDWLDLLAAPPRDPASLHGIVPTTVLSKPSALGLTPEFQARCLMTPPALRLSTSG